MNKEKYVLGIGAANVDITGKSKKDLIMKDSNPGSMHVSIGGVTRNVLENLSRLNVDARLISAIGKDVYGDMIVNYSENAGIDMSKCLRVDDCASSTYLAILNSNGDMHLALSDMHIINSITIDYLQENMDLIQNAKVLTFDPCLSEEVIKYITQIGSLYTDVFCDPVSTSYAARVKPYISAIHTIKPNALELAVLSDHKTDTVFDIIEACQILIDKGVRRIFVSLGSKGCLYYDNKGTIIQKAFKPVENMVNASGAGDSFMAAVIYSYINDFDIDRTIKYALASGIAAVYSETTINPGLSVEMIEKIIERG